MKDAVSTSRAIIGALKERAEHTQLWMDMRLQALQRQQQHPKRCDDVRKGATRRNNNVPMEMRL